MTTQPVEWPPAAPPAAGGRRAVAVLAALVLAAGTTVLPLGAAGSPAGVAPAPAARSAAFSATVAVEWVDGRGRHTTTVDVRAGGGLVRVADASPAGDESVALGHGWLLVSRSEPGAAPGTLPPAVERKYDVERQEGPVVAGRPTTMTVLRAGGEIRERLAVDETSGLVLRREVFGPDDRPVRTVTVTALDDGPAAAVTDDDGGPPSGGDAVAVDPGELPSLYRNPEELAGGYRRVATFRRDRVVHVLYSDGLHGLSLFLQPGSLSRQGLPAGAAPAEVVGAGALRYTWAGGEIVTWASGPVVRTLVGDAAGAEVLAAAASVPPTPARSLMERVRAACRQVAGVLGAG